MAEPCAQSGGLLATREVIALAELPDVVPYSVATWRRMIASGQAPAPELRLGRRLAYRADTIRAWIDRQAITRGRVGDDRPRDAQGRYLVTGVAG